MNDTTDKIDCFARIDEKTCNALNEKKCKNCSFYKPSCEVSNYSRFLAMGKKELKKVKKEVVINEKN